MCLIGLVAAGNKDWQVRKLLLIVSTTGLYSKMLLLKPAWWRSPFHKLADDTSPATLSGRLVMADSGYLLLEVPNAFVRGVFSQLAVPGIELPPRSSDDGRLRAHISVMRAEEVEKIPGKITELGKVFRYQLGQLREVKPSGWEDVEKVWFVRVDSPELKTLRKSYGLPALPVKNGKEMPFHITCALRRRNVLRAGQKAKVVS